MERTGICAAGNLLADTTFPIDRWPLAGELTTIREGVVRTAGGLVCNVLADLARLDPTLPLYAAGRVGADDDGRFLMRELYQYKCIDVSRVIVDGKTSFTHVMSDQSTMQRTFFHFRGSNAAFSPEDLDLASLPAAFLHIGYILLLDAMDAPDPQYGTRLASVLAHAQALGIRTSIDVVSETGDRFSRLVLPALRYTDDCIINEREAEQITAIPLRDADGALLRQNMPRALAQLLAFGVARRAVIHCPEGGFALEPGGGYVGIDSVPLPDGSIAGTVGAGDAFCAGMLLGAYRGWDLSASLELATAAAACSLFAPGASEGVPDAHTALMRCRAFRSGIPSGHQTDGLQKQP